MLQPCKSCFACLPSIPWCLPAIKTFPYVAGGEPPHTRLFPYVARLLSLDILGSSRMSRGSSPSTYSALPVCRAAPLPRHTRLFPYVMGGSRHILGSSRMSRASSCMSRLPSRNIFGPRHPPLHPFPLLHSPCTVALHYNR